MVGEDFSDQYVMKSVKHVGGMGMYFDKRLKMEMPTLTCLVTTIPNFHLLSEQWLNFFFLGGGGGRRGTLNPIPML